MKEKVPHPKLLSEKAVKLINKPIKAKTFFFFWFIQNIDWGPYYYQALSPGYGNKQDKCKHMEFTV